MASVPRGISLDELPEGSSKGKGWMFDTVRLLVKEFAIAKRVGEDKVSGKIDAMFARRGLRDGPTLRGAARPIAIECVRVSESRVVAVRSRRVWLAPWG